MLILTLPVVVGRVTPCAPCVGTFANSGAHGVTRPTTQPI
jgi:hypothetical protein